MCTSAQTSNESKQRHISAPCMHPLCTASRPVASGGQHPYATVGPSAPSHLCTPAAATPSPVAPSPRASPRCPMHLGRARTRALACSAPLCPSATALPTALLSAASHCHTLAGGKDEGRHKGDNPQGRDSRVWSGEGRVVGCRAIPVELDEVVVDELHAIVLEVMQVERGFL